MLHPALQQVNENQASILTTAVSQEILRCRWKMPSQHLWEEAEKIRNGEALAGSATVSRTTPETTALGRRAGHENSGTSSRFLSLISGILLHFSLSMKPWTSRLALLMVLFGIAFGQNKKVSKTDAEIKEAIIKGSIANYRGSCPCPYNTDRAGRSCGKRSAYSRPGGASPLCYASNVTSKMVADYRKKSE
jgi:hypothetical protein